MIYTDLPVTPEIVEAVMANPDVTYDDLRSVCASVENAPDMGIASPWVEVLLSAMGDVVLREYYNVPAEWVQVLIVEVEDV